MRKSVYTGAYKAVTEAIREARKRAALTQRELAERLERPQSFVAKVERGERRLDVIEFATVATAIGVSPVRLFSSILKKSANI